MSIVSTLFPPTLTLRVRSSSNVSIASASSRSGSETPAHSIAPSTPNFSDLSPRSSDEVPQSHFIELVPRIVEHLDARDILNLSATSRHCRDLRTSLTFQRHLTLNGWDKDAVVRRAEMAKDSDKGRPWMYLARSALDKGDILQGYALLPKEVLPVDKSDEKADKRASEKISSKEKRAVEKFLRVLVDIATEHDRHNFETLTAMAATLNLSFIRFVAAVRAHDWKTRCRKTFVIAAFTNAQPLYPEAESDLEGLSDTLDFDSTKPPLSFIATRANFLYTYACISSTVGATPTRLSSIHYDPPHKRTSSSSSLVGLRQALNRLTPRCAVKGFYRKAGGDVSSMHVAFEPKGLASKTKIPIFVDKDLLTLTATVTDGDNEPWQIEGFIDLKTGVGKLKNLTRDMLYEVWVTPWGITGEKIRGESKHLGYFVLHWV